MTATLSPLPGNLSLCTTPSGSACIVRVAHWPSTRVASKGSMSYSASDPSHLALADCVAGDCTTWGENSTCAATSCTFNRTAANRHGQGERLWIKNFDMASHYVSDTEGAVYLNTQRDGVRDTLAGNMLQYENGKEKLFAVLGSGLAADRFAGSWRGVFSVVTMGWINCPSDMHLYAGWLDLKGVIC
ncbi:MAG: hypothetical protein M3179_12450 [Actinomycetota bacterium]|nr:hypothetical protein [Actinomycetota bacterium]